MKIILLCFDIYAIFFSACKKICRNRRHGLSSLQQPRSAFGANDNRRGSNSGTTKSYECFLVSTFYANHVFFDYRNLGLYDGVPAVVDQLLSRVAISPQGVVNKILSNSNMR